MYFLKNITPSDKVVEVLVSIGLNIKDTALEEEKMFFLSYSKVMDMTYKIRVSKYIIFLTTKDHKTNCDIIQY